MPFKAFSFPAEYNDVTITNANLDFDLELIYSTENLNADPVLVRSKFDRTSTMVGSGKVVLPFNGGKSKAYDFLIEKREQTRVDSFYLFGQPAPACLPNFFGTSQGNVIASGDRYLFWVENAKQPLLIINNDLNNNIIFASYLRSHIDTAEVSIAATNYTLNKNFNVFPNPVQDQLFIELKDDAVATISFTDMMSKSINIEIAEKQNGKMINMSTLPKGSYILQAITLNNTFIKLLLSNKYSMSSKLYFDNYCL